MDEDGSPRLHFERRRFEEGLRTDFFFSLGSLATTNSYD
jgi:hypothetical protein